jgi:hypothetical protein
MVLMWLTKVPLRCTSSLNQFLPLQHSIPAQGRAILCLIVADVIINHDFKTRRNRQQHTAACQRAVWRVGV